MPIAFSRATTQYDRRELDPVGASQHPLRGPSGSDRLGHGEGTILALPVNGLVASGELAGPIAFSRDHLDAGTMAHSNVMTERMKDGSDVIADWQLLDAMTLCASMADLVALHSGGDYSGYMMSAGLTVIADGTAQAAERLAHALTIDAPLGLIRYADAVYAEPLEDIESYGVLHIRVS
jgi:urocanate hydratase